MESLVEIPSLLGELDPYPVETVREHGASNVVLTCEHAGRFFPQTLARLGVSPVDAKRHIAWDIGIARLSRLLSDHLDAPLIMQRYSRLVVDCNRQPHAEDFIVTFSEDTPVPGNVNLAHTALETRKREIFDPYHKTIENLLNHRAQRNRKSVVISMHSFTPTYKGVSRPWHVGMLHNPGNRLARYAIANLSKDASLCVGDNQPYRIDVENDYTISTHAIARGLEHLVVEIRQDLIAESQGQRAWADRLGLVIANYLAKHQR